MSDIDDETRWVIEELDDEGEWCHVSARDNLQAGYDCLASFRDGFPDVSFRLVRVTREVL